MVTVLCNSTKQPVQSICLLQNVGKTIRQKREMVFSSKKDASVDAISEKETPLLPAYQHEEVRQTSPFGS